MRRLAGALYVAAAVLVLVGLVWIGQGLGYIRGSFMTGQLMYTILGIVLVVGGTALAWRTRRSAGK